MDTQSTHINIVVIGKSVASLLGMRILKVKDGGGLNL